MIVYSLCETSVFKTSAKYQLRSIYSGEIVFQNLTRHFGGCSWQLRKLLWKV